MTPYNTDYIDEVAAYIRVSSQEQKVHGLSLDAQRQKLSEYAEKNNLKIVEWYEDQGVSGRKLIKKRPELQRMIHDAQKGNFKRIIFIKLDRFFRSVAEYHECMKLIDPVIWTATEEKYDLSTANGRAFVNMKLTIAELEADQTGERIKIVNEYKVKSGIPLFGTNNMPFCYAVLPPKYGEKHKYIVKDPEMEPVMMDLIERVEMVKSIRSAMGYINQKYGLQLSYESISRALRNELICGSYRGNPNYCDAYISRERYDALQKIISRNPRTAKKNRVYLFAGLLKCPHCGRILIGGQQHNTKKNGKRYQYNSYRCASNRRDKSCDFSKGVMENTVEKLLLNKVALMVESKKAESMELSNGERVNKYDLNALESELDRLNYSWQKGRIKSVEEYDKQYDDLMVQISEAMEEQAEYTSDVDYDRIQSVLVSGWQDIYRELDPEHKRAFWRSFIEEIELDWDKKIKELYDIKFF